MPIYEFHCKTCRQEFKSLLRSQDTSHVTCPTCRSPKVARMLSVTARTSASGGDACALPGG